MTSCTSCQARGVIDWLGGALQDDPHSRRDQWGHVHRGQRKSAWQRPSASCSLVCKDEAFVLLSSECEFWLEGQTFTRRAGESVFIPRGGVSTPFASWEAIPAGILAILTPGGFEGFFADMAQGGFRIAEDMERIVACAARHSLRVTGPPLGAE